MMLYITNKNTPNTYSVATPTLKMENQYGRVLRGGESGSGGGSDAKTICALVTLVFGIATLIVAGVLLFVVHSRVSNLEDEMNNLPEVRVKNSTEPCDCMMDTSAAAACSDGLLWYNTVDKTDYACNSDTGQWWTTEDHDAWGESSSGTDCASGNNPSTQDACALAWGAGIGPDNQRIGRFFKGNITITGISYADDDDASQECTGGADSFDIQVWNSAAPVSVNFTLLATLATQQTESQLFIDNLNVPVMSGMYLSFGIANNCGAVISDFTMTIYYRVNPYSYV